jgi:selenoprotein W-related protein
LTGLLLESLKTRIKEIKLIPSRGGCFEVKINGELIYSKLDTGVFPDEAAILDAARNRLQAKK